MTDVLTDKIISGGRHNMALAQVAKTMENFAHPLRHSGLTRTGTSGEGHVQGGRRCVQAQLQAGAIDHQQGRNFTNSRLYWLKTNQIPIQLIQHGLDAGSLIGQTQIHMLWPYRWTGV